MVTVDDIGKRVEDSAGRVGILRDVIPDWEDPAELPQKRRKQPTAFIWPEPVARNGWRRPPPYPGPENSGVLLPRGRQPESPPIGQAVEYGQTCPA